MTTPTSSDLKSDAFALHEFMNSLRRLFKVGIYYPTGHVILDKATTRFMTQLQQMAGDKPYVEFRVVGNSILLQEIELDSEQPAVKEFNILLSTLGVVAIRMDRHISMQDLHTFVRTMLSFRAKTINTKQFTQFELTGIPSTIEIERLEFLSRGDSSKAKTAPESSENLHTFVSSLSQYGLNEKEIEQCRMLLEKLPERLEKSSLDRADLPSASWDDIARLLARAVRGGTAEGNSTTTLALGSKNINALTSILKKLETETKDSKAREALSLLLSVIRKPPLEARENETVDEELSLATFPEKPSVSAARIQEFATNFKLAPKICVKIPQSSQHNETLSILMQLAGHEQSLPAQLHMQKLIREALHAPLSEKSWKILSGGIHTVLQTGNESRLAAAIRFLVEPLRHSAHSNTLRLFHFTVQLCDEAEQKVLWPYVVNELLVEGSSKDKLVYHQLCQFAVRLNYEEMSAALPKLRAMEAFEESKVATDIFLAVSPTCYTLFAFLLKTELERYIGERVIGGLRRHPRDWFIKAVAPLLEIEQQEHKLFLYSYLRQGGQKVIPVSLKKIAARMIVTTLKSLSQERRNEHWVENTIAALAQLPDEGSMELLRQITSSKKMLFLHDWPAPCRTAAQNALAAAKR